MNKNWQFSSHLQGIVQTLKLEQLAFNVTSPSPTPANIAQILINLSVCVCRLSLVSEFQTPV